MFNGKIYLVWVSRPMCEWQLLLIIQFSAIKTLGFRKGLLSSKEVVLKVTGTMHRTWTKCAPRNNQQNTHTQPGSHWHSMTPFVTFASASTTHASSEIQKEVEQFECHDTRTVTFGDAYKFCRCKKNWKCRMQKQQKANSKAHRGESWIN